MVSRKTRLKGGSHVSTGKGADVQKVSVGLKTTSKIKTAKMAKSKENKKLIKRSDAYIFDETDDFVSGSSILSATSSSSNIATTSTTKSSAGKKQREHGVRKASFVKPQSNTDNVKRCKYFKQLKQNNFKSENGSSKTQQTVLIKKTSTPLASLTPENPDKQKNCFLDCRIVIPKLNLDLTVTPILPICTPPLTKLSSQCSKSVSFSDISCLKQNDSRETPKHPDMKPVTKSTGLKDKELFAAVAHVRDLKLKKKYSRTYVKSPTQNTSRSRRAKLPRKDTIHQNKLNTNVSALVAAKTPLPKGKTESNCLSSMLHKQKGVLENQVDIICKKSVPKDTPTDLPSCKTTKKEKTPAGRQKPDRTKKTAVSVSHGVLSNKAQTEHILGKTETISIKTRVKKPGHKESCTSKLFDSGISLGGDVSNGGGICSLLPGFMEEPLQSELQVFLADSPVSSSVIGSNVSDPASFLNKSLKSEGYKRSAKREKGRYSTSKLEAWASAVSQSLEELESFELLVE